MLSEEFKFTPLKKREKLEILSEQDQQIHKRLAKSLAILIRYTNYVNIKNLYETIGDEHQMSKLILEEYTKTFNFTGLDIIKAYELYVSTFTLTGEQCHIYNFICSFATKWYNDNKDQSKDSFYFRSDEEVISFAYSIMLLNTDLHNPNITNHITLEGFLKNNVSSNLFKDVPNEYMVNIFNRIQETPLKAAQPRSGNYLKEDELYADFECRHDFISKEGKYFNKDLIEELDNNYNNITYENFPLINLLENLNNKYESKKEIIDES